MNLALHGRQARGSHTMIALAETGATGVSILGFEQQVNRALIVGRRVIVIDLLSISLIDNETLGDLCVALRQASVCGASLRVVTVDGRVQRVLELCEIDGLEFYPSVRRALRRRSARLAHRARLPWLDALMRQPRLNRSASGPPS